MIRRSIVFLSLAFAVLWTAPVRAGDQPQAEARRVTAAEAREALAKGTAVLVDVRAADSYASEHAKGAVSIPLSQVAARAGELPKDKLIITYCT